MEGLLTAIFVGYREIEKSQFVPVVGEDFYDAEGIRVPADPAKAERVRRGVTQTFGQKFYNYIVTSHHAANPEGYTIIARVIKGAYLHGRPYLESAAEEVLDFTQMVQDVQGEVQAYQEQLRFQEIRGGYLFAEFAPENDILDLLTRHFVLRMPQDQLILLDRSRQKMSLYNNGVTLSCDVSRFEFDGDLPDEFFDQCWTQFSRVVKIDKTKDLKDITDHMPRRFLKYPTGKSQE